MNINSRLKKIIDSVIFSSSGSYDIEILLNRLDPIDKNKAEKLGIHVHSEGSMPKLFVTDDTKFIGHINIHSIYSDNIILFDNLESNGQLFASINIHGSGTQCIFNDAGKNYVSLHALNLRSHNQSFFFGKDSTAVGLSVEMEGEENLCVIGEDALISSGVWLRNHDMHSIVDLEKYDIINKLPGDILIERHVWLGQDVLAVGGQRIGFGSIVGARSFVKKPIPPKSVAAGLPAKIIRNNTSWGRQSGFISKEEIEIISYLSEKYN